MYLSYTGCGSTSGRASASGSGRPHVRISAVPYKTLKMVPVATLLGAQQYKARTGFSSPNKYCTTSIASITKYPQEKSDNNPP